MFVLTESDALILILSAAQHSGPGKQVLAESELDGIEISDIQSELRFDGDPVQFRLGIEARRIDIAFAYEMAAVAVSNIQPLPHQLEAVYDCFLREPRLRYLLADDPGAGKTIMAGLYMKELILRRSGDRILVVTPANLRPQWIRELAERFQLDFVQLGANHFDASLTENPWDQFDRIVVSRDFLRTDRAREAFDAAEKEWDLAVVDEAHGFTIAVNGKGFINKKSERYKAAEAVARRSHRLILMTATPHSGRDYSLWALLRLLDLDAWGDRCPRKLEVPPHHFRKVSKEIMRDMSGNKLFKDRHPQRVEYEITGDEWELYNAVTDFVSKKLKEIRGDSPKSTAGFALTTMQRRVASSTRAIRRTLERRLDRLEKALEDPAAYLRNRKAFQASLVDEGDELEDLDEADRWALEEQALEEWLPDTVAELEAEREAVRPLLALAQEVEAKRTERKLTGLLDVVRNLGLKADRRKQLLIFTEHKDTLDYLVENLATDFEVAQIHGQMKLPERIEQERFFRETAQIMVATEAAGEGINLQFCHLMVNYDIPWNPNRLEQRMGRIHRIGQTEDVYIFNLVASNTREGYVLSVLLKKMENMGHTLGDKVFDVVGQAIGTNLREVLEAVIAGEMTKEEATATFGGAEVDPATKARAEELLESALARDHLDWETERDRAARAEERRLPPSYFERFFVDAITYAGGTVTKRLDPGTWRVDRSPNVLVARSRTASGLRQIATDYKRLTFDKSVAARPRRTEEEADLAGSRVVRTRTSALRLPRGLCDRAHVTRGRQRRRVLRSRHRGAHGRPLRGRRRRRRQRRHRPPHPRRRSGRRRRADRICASALTVRRHSIHGRDPSRGGRCRESRVAGRPRARHVGAPASLREGLPRGARRAQERRGHPGGLPQALLQRSDLPGRRKDHRRRRRNRPWDPGRRGSAPPSGAH